MIFSIGILLIIITIAIIGISALLYWGRFRNLNYEWACSAKTGLVVEIIFWINLALVAISLIVQVAVPSIWITSVI